jgi:hypothetical protein
VRIDETRDLNIEEKAARWKWKNTPICDCADWTPEVGKKRSVSRWASKNKILINSLCILPTGNSRHETDSVRVIIIVSAIFSLQQQPHF